MALTGSDLPSTPTEPAPAAGLVSNATIDAQLGHRTIRAFTPEPVAEAQIATLLDVARHGASCAFYQQFTIIRIKDPQLREVIYRASGQPYVGGDLGELFLFLVDLARNAAIRTEQGADLEPIESTSMFLQGVEDTMIAAQNMAVAAESLGLGTCYLASIIGDPESIIEALDLPRYTYPLVGMLIGHPDQEPQFKPRLPREITTAVDAYPQITAPEQQDGLAAYDQTLQTYYDLREDGKPQMAFTQQIARRPGMGRAEKTDVQGVLNSQGLCLH